MTQATMEALLVEDNPADARLVREMLADIPTANIALTHVDRLSDALPYLHDGAIDAVVLDLSLPDGHGLDVVRQMHAAAPQVPLVIMSGNEDEEVSIAGVRAGAQNYLAKGDVDGVALVRALHYAIERGRAEGRLAHLAYYDALTGLPNRALFQDRLAQALAHGRRTPEDVVLLFLDLDGFKEVNDARGHDIGDLLLQEVARRLRLCVRDGDTVARLGGDEFTVILPRVAHAHDAVTVAERILDHLAAPLILEGHSVDVTVSIGIALSAAGAHGADELTKCADTAMYWAKTAGKNCYAVFTADMAEQADPRRALEGELRAAIAAGELLLHYQPLIDIRTGRPRRVEALVRWPHPRHGLLSPDRVIPLAEQTGAIAALTEWALDRALAQRAAWRRVGLDVNIAVDVPLPLLQDPDAPDRVAALLERHAAPPTSLTLDVTEGAIMAQPARALAALARLTSLGPRLAIDDFGAGYSSLSLLKHLPAHDIKIDRSFIQNVTADAKDATIVRAVIGLAHGLGLNVVAEGVDDQATYALLDSVGCDLAQGDYISRPLSPADLERWLRETSISRQDGA